MRHGGDRRGRGAALHARRRAGRQAAAAREQGVPGDGRARCCSPRSRAGATLLPIDSEHNAIFQCLPHGSRAGVTPPGVQRVLLTASGGPFRDTPREALESVTPEAAVAHPNWVMGRKISVDSATLMNKGLELIEACLLFGLKPEQVDIVVHPQSIVHSLVEYMDGSVLAQLGAPDMRTPIAHALAWPERIGSGVEFLDLSRPGAWISAPPISRSSAAWRWRRPRRAPAARIRRCSTPRTRWRLQAFLERRLNFPGIAAVIEAVVQRGTGGVIGGLEDVLAADAEGRVRARERILGMTKSASVKGAHA